MIMDVTACNREFFYIKCILVSTFCIECILVYIYFEVTIVYMDLNVCLPPIDYMEVTIDYLDVCMYTHILKVYIYMNVYRYI